MSNGKYELVKCKIHEELILQLGMELGDETVWVLVWAKGHMGGYVIYIV